MRRLCWDLAADGCWYAVAPDASIWCRSVDGQVKDITGKHKGESKEKSVRRDFVSATDVGSETVINEE